MAPLSLRLKITPQTLAPTALRLFSSSPFPDQNPSFNGENDENLPSPKSSLVSLFSDTKKRLRSPPSPPLRIPCDPPPPSIASSIPNPATSFKEIRKYRLRSSPSMPSRNPNPPPKTVPPPSKRSATTGSASDPPSVPSRNPNPLSQDVPTSFEEIRKYLDGFDLRSSSSMPSRNPNPPPKTVPPPSKRSATTGSASDPPSMPSRNPNPPPKTVPPPSKRSASTSTGSTSDPPSMPSRNPNPLSQDVPTSIEEIRKYLYLGCLPERAEREEEEEILRTPVIKLDGYDELREELRMLKRS